MSKNCPYCSALIVDLFKFCPYCGQSLEIEPQTEEDSANRLRMKIEAVKHKHDREQALIHTSRVKSVPVYPKCDQVGCFERATYTCVWNHEQNYCEQHALRVLAVGEIMAFDTPALTMARLVVFQSSEGSDKVEQQ